MVFFNLYLFNNLGWIFVSCINFEHVRKLYNLLPDEFEVFFTYFVQNFNSIPSPTDSSKTMSINTTMLVAVARKTYLQEFKFAGYTGYTPLGKFYLKFLIL